MSGDASDSSEDSDTQTNEKACTVKHQITNGKSVILQTTRTYMNVRYKLKMILCNRTHILLNSKSWISLLVQIYQLMTVFVYPQLICATMIEEYL